MIQLTDRERQWIDSMGSYLSDSQIVSIVGAAYFQAYLCSIQVWQPSAPNQFTKPKTPLKTVHRP
jgi:hypothetical protein